MVKHIEEGRSLVFRTITMSEDSSVNAAVVRQLEYMRAHPDEPLELEARVVVFSNDADCKVGYADFAVARKLVSRLEYNAKEVPNWSSVPSYQMVRGEHDQGIRQTCRPPAPDVFQQKNGVSRVDMVTDREYHLRVALAKELPVDAKKQVELRTKAPKSVRLMHRASFIEEVPALSVSALPLTFQWDISKVSDPAPTKKECTDKPCRYHCEVELKTKLSPLQDKELERAQNELIASLFLDRARALLGTHYQSSPDSLVALPPAKLVLLHK
jgi:hypothetical protein